MKLEIGGGFLATLTIIFVIAKILGYIDWSWWIVFLPVLISLIGIVIIFFMLIFLWVFLGGDLV